jgi:hypothetical protein
VIEKYIAENEANIDKVQLHKQLKIQIKRLAFVNGYFYKLNRKTSKKSTTRIWKPKSENQNLKTKI